jgi:hypothetical protein
VWSAESVVVCALALLGRNQAQFPPIQFVEKPPAYVSRLAQAYIQGPDARIVLVTSTSAFVRARRSSPECAEVEAIREIAGVLAHEEWHVLHGADEEDAYNAQLTALLYVGADQNGALYHKIMQAKQVVTRRASRAGVLASATPSIRVPPP